MRQRRRRNEHRLMAALGVAAVSAMVMADGGLSREVSDLPAHEPPEAANLPLVRLHLSGADMAHFERLYTLLDGSPRNPVRYRQKNTWRRAQLGYDDRLYDIRVKSHGRDPDYHSERLAGWRYRFISLTIRLEAGERILGLNRFKLIVHGAFPDAASIMGMARHVGAFVQDHRLVRVRINNWPEHLFYISNILDHRYLESIGFGPVQRLSYDYPDSGRPQGLAIPDNESTDHSLIYTDGQPLQFEPAAFRRRFELALAQMEIPESDREPLFKRYVAFNAALSGSAGSDADPTELLDPGYMQRYETARYVLGMNGHGSIFGNLRVLLNTANGKFYPAFHRDNQMAELDLSGGRIPEHQINNLGAAFTNPDALPLFRYAATSDRLRQRVYRGIYEFIEGLATGAGGPAGSAGRGGSECRNWPFAPGLPFVGDVRPVGGVPCGAASPPSTELVSGTVASSNIESLRTWLEASAPEFSAEVAADRLRLSVRPNSMSALRVQTLALGGDLGNGPVRVDVTERQGARERLVIEAQPAALRADETLDLGGALGDARFFTGLDVVEVVSPLEVNIRWIAGLEDANRQRLEQRFGLLNGAPTSAQTWQYWLEDTSPERLAEVVGDDAVEDTHGFDRGDVSLADQERDLRRNLTRAPHLYQLVFTFSRPLLGLQVESIALTLVNTVTGQEVAARRVATIEASDGEALSPASAFAGSTDLFEDWAAAHQSLAPRRTGPREITLARGVHDLQSDVVFPAGYDVVIEGGTEFRLGPGVVMLIHGGMTMAGSAGNPVTVRPIDIGQPFGTVAVLGDGSQRTTIRHLDLSGGSDAWVRGARFSGALSIHYQHDVEVSHASIHGNRGEGGLSIKYARGLLADSVFMGNQVNQIGLDYFDGVVRGNRLTGSGAADQQTGGLDVTGSRLVATGNEFIEFSETGVRVAENSVVLFAANTWRDNALAMAVTDLSTVYLHDDNEFDTNDLDVSAFLHKPYFGGGTVVLAGNAGPVGLSLVTDRLSTRANVSHAAIERLHPTEIPPAEVVSSLTDLSVVSRR